MNFRDFILLEGKQGGMPPAPMGTTPIPEGHLRFYHFTRADKSTILNEGILIKHARVEKFGEPNEIWANVGDKIPENFDAKRYVEFSLHSQDRRIGGTIRDGGDKTQATFIGDILPEDIIYVHELGRKENICS